MKRGRKRETKAAREARLNFYTEVLSMPGCWVREVLPHECDGPMDPCHLIDKSWLKTHAAFTLRLDEAGVLACVWDARNGRPGCRRGHNLFDSPFTTVLSSELPESVFGFATDYKCLHRLEHMYGELAA